MSRFCEELLFANGSYWCNTKVFVFLTLILCPAASEMCEKVNSCRCEFRNGSVIDLQSLAAVGKARWENIIAVKPDNFTYYYNPCFNFKLPKDGSKPTISQCANGVAACQVSKDRTNTSYYSLGSQQTAEFKWDQEEHVVQLVYSSSSLNISIINLKCNEDPGASDTLVVSGKVKDSPQIIKMTLTSRCACPDLCGHRGLSAGSVLIILFSVFVILYLLFGMFFNKLTRGAQGWELIPNYEFWQDFPLLVRDGCVYVASGCKSDTTYERI